MKSRARIEDISDVDVTLEENEEIVTDYHDEDPPKIPISVLSHWKTSLTLFSFSRLVRTTAIGRYS